MYNQEYLESLITNKVEENLNLDYKAAGSLEKKDKKVNEISKDISAFANSDGGIVIYGITENSVNKHLPETIEPIDRNSISKEWLEQIINGNIRPRIDGVVINPIEIDSDKDKVVYLLEIPKSTTAHQANDKKYYKRFNFNSEPMHDYEIRDIMSRIKNPIIDIEFEIEKRKELKTKYVLHGPSKSYDVDKFTLKVFAKNIGRVYANYVNSYLYISEECLEDKYYKVWKDNKRRIYLDNTIRDVLDVKVLPTTHGVSSTPKYGPSRYDPILPTLRFELDTIELTENAFDIENDIEWIVYVDNAEPRKGKIYIHEIMVQNV